MDNPVLVQEDPWLEPYREAIEKRTDRYRARLRQLTAGTGTPGLSSFAGGHHYYGAHREHDGWVFREWAPNAEALYLVGDFSGWKAHADFSFSRINEYGDWELAVPMSGIHHTSLYRLFVRWKGGEGDRIPAYARRVVQDRESGIFNAQLWHPETPYQWKRKNFVPGFTVPLIYESHIGMAQEEGKVGSFAEFTATVVPRIVKAGYNTLQLMALMEHPYYGSFGYQVSSFFALSSRFGTPEDFKALVDACHHQGIAVLMDIIHSHGVKNEVEGIGLQDGTPYLYFHDGPKGYHPAWDSRCFDYGKDGVIHFLLSNCAFWLEEYGLDGFRFDGVTSMLYRDHGLGASFDHYDKYFSDNVDEDAFTYLALANHLIHEINEKAFTIAEDMSGLPGISRPPEIGGAGFDFRLAMGIPDFWIKLIKEKRDEEWNVEEIWSTLNNRRFTEKNIAYAESHDQALVGDKSIIFRLMDAAMYTDMDRNVPSTAADRGLALHKIIRLLTFSLGGDGYLNFMGNEFGHPEWIDFPREGNNWSYHYARRQWHLADDTRLRYCLLAEFDRQLIAVCTDCLGDTYAEGLFFNIADQVLAYRRGDLYFFISLNPTDSFTDYRFPISTGEYTLILSSDAEVFGGFGRVNPGEPIVVSHNKDSGPDLSLYLPTRTALVFQRRSVPDPREIQQ